MTAKWVSKSAAFGAGLLLLWQLPLSAADDFIAPPPWQEQRASLPAYPADADLLPFRVDQPALSQTFNIDARSLSVGDDGVVRYSVVIVSDSGARNVQFEGMRCATRESRTYAYGKATQGFIPAQGDKWQAVSQYGWAGFRAVLLRDFLCNLHLSPYSLHEIKYRLRHPPGG